MSNIRLLASNFTFSPVSSKNADSIKRRREITIISFSRSICRKELAALIGVTGKPYPSCLSCHSHPIRPCGAPSPSGEGCDTRIPSSKKGGEAATRTLNPEPNESKVKGCEEMRIHFFTASFLFLFHYSQAGTMVPLYFSAMNFLTDSD